MTSGRELETRATPNPVTVLRKRAPGKVRLWSCFCLKCEATLRRGEDETVESNILIHKSHTKRRQEWLESRWRPGAPQIQSPGLLLRAPNTSFKTLFPSTGLTLLVILTQHLRVTPFLSLTTQSVVTRRQLCFRISCCLSGKALFPRGAGGPPLPGPSSIQLSLPLTRLSQWFLGPSVFHHTHTNYTRAEGLTQEYQQQQHFQRAPSPKRCNKGL